MSLLHSIKVKLWRPLPLRYRQRVLYGLGKILPSKNLTRLLEAMGGGIYRREVQQAGVLFIHVPKAGGTSISRAIYGIDGVGHHRAVEARETNPSMFDRLYRFSVVRNPWERLLSAFQFVSRGGTSEVMVDNSDFYRKENWKSFDQFVLDWLVNQSPESLDPVFMPQHMFVCDANGNLLVHDLYDLYELDRLSRNLSSRLGRSLSIPHVNSTGSKDELMSAYRDPNVVDAVAGYYARDIELFDYQYQRG